MTTITLIRRSLSYYWRTNLAVIAGVATAVAVLAGALLVGQSVRSSLRNLVLERIGNTGSVIAAANFFGEDLAEAFTPACPLISIDGAARHQLSGRFASGVKIYGVDDRFWQFHGHPHKPPSGREIYLSEAVALELEAKAGEGVLLRLEQPSYVPAESLQGSKEESAKTIRFSTAGVLPREFLGEFSLGANQGPVKAVFVPLARLQEELDQVGRVNTLLLGPEVENAGETLRQAIRLEDFGIGVRALPGRRILQVDSWGGMLSDSVAEAAREQARRLGAVASGVFTYLANTIRNGDREIPYSLVAAVELPPPTSEGQPVIDLNQWAAGDLRARRGDLIGLEYYLWHPGGRLTTHTAEFRFRDVRPVQLDTDYAPEYPGITDSDDVTDWDPPFPIDLSRVREQDEEYWDRYRTTPKAFISLDEGQKLWRSPYGEVTALRIPIPGDADDIGSALAALREGLRGSLDPVEQGFLVIPVREQGLAGSQGATDFGEYFVYFSFFLVVSAVLLAALFFRLSVEQRVGETGLLEAVGIPRSGVRRVLAGEGLVLAVAGAILGIAGAMIYCEVILLGLRTWWVGAVGTQAIRLDADPVWLAAGAGGGVVAAFVALLGTLRVLSRVSPKNRLAGVMTPPDAGRGNARRSGLISVVATLLALLLLASSAAGRIPDVAGFFGAGMLILVAALLLVRTWAMSGGRAMRAGAGTLAVARLGIRNATSRPGRTVLSVALIASAIFLIVSVDAFRLSAPPAVTDPKSPTGGFPLMAESTLPLYHSPASEEGREALGLDHLDQVRFTPFRLRPGDDISCLNLYRPQSPRVLGATRDFLMENRFSFQDWIAPAGGTADPWLLLLGEETNGAVPAAVSANSLTYVLHRKLGDEIEIPLAEGRSVRLQLVATLSDSIFQRELLISEDNFRKLFPTEEGFRVFLIDAPAASADEVTSELEDRLADFGIDVVSTAERLASFHEVENTYLSTFQALGALGLVLGTIGLGIILLRNVVERRRELALLRAVGYEPRHIAIVVLAESGFLLITGIVIGVATAALAIAPALASRGGSVSLSSLGILLAAVLCAGMLSSLTAAIVAIRSPLLPALRAE